MILEQLLEESKEDSSFEQAIFGAMGSDIEEIREITNVASGKLEARGNPWHEDRTPVIVVDRIFMGGTKATSGLFLKAPSCIETIANCKDISPNHK